MGRALAYCGVDMQMKSFRGCAGRVEVLGVGVGLRVGYFALMIVLVMMMMIMMFFGSGVQIYMSVCRSCI